MCYNDNIFIREVMLCLSQNQSNYVTDDKADLITSDFMDFFGVENEDSSNIDNIKDFDRKDKTSGL